MTQDITFICVIYQVASCFIGWYDDEEGADLSVEIDDKTAKLTVHLVKAAE